MDAGSQWVIKLGPLERQNGAASKEQAELGARRLVMDTAKNLMKKTSDLAPGFLEGVAGPTGAGHPEIVTEEPEVEVHSYELGNGSWFSLAKSNSFGYKVVCRKA